MSTKVYEIILVFEDLKIDLITIPSILHTGTISIFLYRVECQTFPSRRNMLRCLKYL
jgi:hypothetical protein